MIAAVGAMLIGILEFLLKAIIVIVGILFIIAVIMMLFSED